jgi:hypothetical protein
MKMTGYAMSASCLMSGVHRVDPSTGSCIICKTSIFQAKPPRMALDTAATGLMAKKKGPDRNRVPPVPHI